MELLYCDETPILAQVDQRLLTDSRVLDNLLQMEASTLPPMDYLQNLQPEIQPYMRKVLTTWMLEVCEEQECEEQVFPLSVNFLDRFLCTCPVRRCHLQLAAAVCLLLASKVRQCCALTLDLLSFYTDYSVSVKLLREWEMLVLSRLRWDIAAITAYDYLDHLSARLPLPRRACALVRRHAHTFVALCCTESELMLTPPSLVAAACLGAAVRGLRVGEAACKASLSTLLHATRADAPALDKLMARIDDAVLQASSSPPASSSGSSAPNSASSVAKSTSIKSVAGGETPTDVQDVCF